MIRTMALTGRAVLAATAVLAAGLAFAAAPAVSAQTPGDVEVRDRLIADQENLLNAYRCLFAVDVDVVPGGCPNPDQVAPGPAPQNPTTGDIEVRDRLIADQEALLNVYRCQFDVDTQLVPGGCPGGGAEPEPPAQTPQNLGPIPLNENWARYLELIVEFKDACGFSGDWDNSTCHRRNSLDLVSTIELSRRKSEFYGCDFMSGGILGYCQRPVNPGPDIWAKRTELARYLEACGYGGSRPSGFSQSRLQCYRDPADPRLLAGPEHNAEAMRLGREAFECDYRLPSRSIWGRPCFRTNPELGYGLANPGMDLYDSWLFCEVEQGWLYWHAHWSQGIYWPQGCYHFDHPQLGRIARCFRVDLRNFPDHVAAALSESPIWCG